jgi:hypothetical protein
MPRFNSKVSLSEKYFDASRMFAGDVIVREKTIVLWSPGD